MVRIPTHRIPTHPGEMLAEEFLIPMKITQRDIAEAIDVPYRKINELVNRHRAMTPAMALRLSKFFGMSADFWMNLQVRWDMYHARKSEISTCPYIFRHNVGISPRAYPLKTGQSQGIAPAIYGKNYERILKSVECNSALSDSE